MRQKGELLPLLLEQKIEEFANLDYSMFEKFEDWV